MIPDWLVIASALVLVVLVVAAVAMFVVEHRRRASEQVRRLERVEVLGRYRRI